jgi:AraC-like DNA-binding protein
VKNYTDPFLTNEVLAGKCHVSEVYFRRIFKEKYGISPKQHIQNMRIKKAQALLRSEYMSIKAIAEMSGYASVYHFSRAFKRVSVYAPTEYIKTFGDSV